MLWISDWEFIIIKNTHETKHLLWAMLPLMALITGCPGGSRFSATGEPERKNWMNSSRYTGATGCSDGSHGDRDRKDRQTLAGLTVLERAACSWKKRLPGLNYHKVDVPTFVYLGT